MRGTVVHTDDNRHAVGSATQRPAAEVLADAIRVLTEAARLRRPVFERDADGAWREHPTLTQQTDWAEFVTHALAGAAANIGSIDAALAGRPGSWEADAVRTLLHSTVGYVEQYLLEHRTEPLHVVVNVEQILTDLEIAELYDDAEAALDQMQDAALAHLDYVPYYWTYTRDDNGQFVADDPNAPAWSIEAWRDSLAAEQRTTEEWLDELQQCLLRGTALGASIIKSPEAARAAAQLAEQEDAISADFDARFAALRAQRDREWATYTDAFAANIRDETARRYPGVPVEIELCLTGAPDAASDDYASPEVVLIEHATLHTPIPGSGIAPKDYPVGARIYDVETSANRLPHLRLPRAS